MGFHKKKKRRSSNKRKGDRSWKNQELDILRSTSKISTKPPSITNAFSAWKKSIGGPGELSIYPTAISISLSSTPRNIRGASITLVSKSIMSKKSRKLPTRKPRTTPTGLLPKAGSRTSKATASMFPSTAGLYKKFQILSCLTGVGELHRVFMHSTHTPRLALLLGALVLFLLAFSPRGVLAQNPSKVTVAYSAVSPIFAGVWMAKEIGAFEKQGLKADLVYISSGSATA